MAELHDVQDEAGRVLIFRPPLPGRIENRQFRGDSGQREPGGQDASLLRGRPVQIRPVSGPVLVGSALRIRVLVALPLSAVFLSEIRLFFSVMATWLLGEPLGCVLSSPNCFLHPVSECPAHCISVKIRMLYIFKYFRKN